MNIVQQNSSLLKDHIDELLAISIVNEEKLSYNESSFSIHDLMDELINYFKERAGSKKVKIKLDRKFKKNIYIKSDRKKIRHILLNYFSNALKFSPKETQILFHCSIQDNNLMFYVKDQGPGLTEKERDKVFQRFYQSENTISESVGTGLGLALSHNLAKVIGAELGVDSTVGIGSTFYLTMPAHINTDFSVQETAKNFSSDKTKSKKANKIIQSKGAKILIVEDNASMVEYLKLELNAYKITACSNGKEALEIIAKLNKNNDLPDLILSDVMMPVMDGFQFLTEIKKREEFQWIPFIMLTARTGMEDKIEALRIGVDDYLKKPFNTLELIIRIENLLKKNKENNASSEIPEKSGSFNHQWLKTLESEVKRNIRDNRFNLSFLSEKMLLSERQLHRRIKTSTGLTPNKYIREVRLFEAKKILESGNVMTVAELCYAVGFEDQHYFSKLYQDRFGVLPSAEL